MKFLNNFFLIYIYHLYLFIILLCLVYVMLMLSSLSFAFEAERVVSSLMSTFRFPADIHCCSHHLKKGEELCIQVCFSFFETSFLAFFVFHVKPGTKINHRTVLSNMLYSNLFSRDSNNSKKNY